MTEKHTLGSFLVVIVVSLSSMLAYEVCSKLEASTVTERARSVSIAVAIVSVSILIGLAVFQYL